MGARNWYNMRSFSRGRVSAPRRAAGAVATRDGLRNPGAATSRSPTRRRYETALRGGATNAVQASSEADAAAMARVAASMIWSILLISLLLGAPGRRVACRPPALLHQARPRPR